LFDVVVIVKTEGSSDRGDEMSSSPALVNNGLPDSCNQSLFPVSTGPF